MDPSASYSVFRSGRCLGGGNLSQAARLALEGPDDAAQSLIVSDETGGIVDLDLRGGKDACLSSLDEAVGETRRRGRPRLGVASREVTMLPKHWDWLAAQSGGASATLRRLVEQAMRSPAEQARSGREAAFRFMSAVAGDYPGYEEAVRAVFACDSVRFQSASLDWPADVREYAAKLARVEAPAKPR
jgi:hypothetical protein